MGVSKGFRRACVLTIFCATTFFVHCQKNEDKEKGILDFLPFKGSSSTAAPDPTYPHQSVVNSVNKTRTMPCKCEEGSCNCCTGNVLTNFNVSMRNKICVNVAYDPDDFEFLYKVMFNERQLYQNTISGKNPPPICLPLRRFLPGTACLRFNNVYMIGRNLHACLTLVGLWQEFELFNISFDCIRVGTSGIAIVKPEEGGGLPIPVVGEDVDPDDLDYNDSAKTILTH
ncbi:uncharacterized protein LOC106671431 isoform X2 [Cimex lectularius]|uniref:DUF4773 domain-containing protein n=1 Tax=Cimex lectularius TaxID=79782 RepID=A0A8I6TMT9_CIMLE|nr:uncharacterized protein LOC106671431 isoform X2 [Cimex lectularius]